MLPLKTLLDIAEASVLSEDNEPWTECEAGHRRIRNGESHIVP